MRRQDANIEPSDRKSLRLAWSSPTSGRTYDCDLSWARFVSQSTAQLVLTLARCFLIAKTRALEEPASGGRGTSPVQTSSALLAGQVRSSAVMLHREWILTSVMYPLYSYAGEVASGVSSDNVYRHRPTISTPRPHGKCEARCKGRTIPWKSLCAGIESWDNIEAFDIKSGYEAGDILQCCKCTSTVVAAALTWCRPVSAVSQPASWARYNMTIARDWRRSILWQETGNGSLVGVRLVKLASCVSTQTTCTTSPEEVSNMSPGHL